MASTKANNTKVAWRYTDDNGHVFAVAAKQCYVEDGTDGVKYGGAAAQAADEAIPNELKMRKVKCLAPGGSAHWVPVYTTTAALWTTPGTQVTLNVLGVDVLCTSTRFKRAESQGRFGKNPS